MLCCPLSKQVEGGRGLARVCLSDVSVQSRTGIGIPGISLGGLICIVSLAVCYQPCNPCEFQACAAWCWLGPAPRHCARPASYSRAKKGVQWVGDRVREPSSPCGRLCRQAGREVTYIYCLQKFMRASTYIVLSLLFFFPRLPSVNKSYSPHHQ